MIVALFLNNSKTQAIEIATKIAFFFHERNIQIVMEDSEAHLFQATPLSHVTPDMIDFRLSLGGDGTLLRLYHKHPEIKAPLLGINLGSLGFLADVPVSDLENCLIDLVEGNYEVQERIVLEGHFPNGDQSFAVNDITFHRGQNPSLIDLSVFVDDLYLNTFSADGLIFATPTGSTAYSLAAGGPILMPHLEAVVLTPICPHTLSLRPLVFYPEQEIIIEYVGKQGPIEVNFDGVIQEQLEPGQSFQMTPSSRTFPLVNFSHHDYFSTLRTKLNLTGKLR